MSRYRESIPPEMRLVYNIFGEIPYFDKDRTLEFTSGIYMGEARLKKFYDSLNPNAVSAILGNGELRKLIEESLCTISYYHNREVRIIKLKVGLEDGKPHTNEEIGKKYNVTRNRIQQLSAKTLRRLRHPSISRKITGYLREQYNKYQELLFE